MSARTGIEWTDATWNPVVGCTKVSQGCKHCYAKVLHDRRHQAHRAGKEVPRQYAVPFERVQLMPERLDTPLGWRAPRRVFVNSVSDLFHEDVPVDFIARVWAVMALAPRHTFQVLTKRPERMRAILSDPAFADAVGAAADPLRAQRRGLASVPVRTVHLAPLPNAWLGTSVEDQKAADERIPHLLETPAAIRFLSCEPLLGPVDLRRVNEYRPGDSWDAAFGWRTSYQSKARGPHEGSIGVWSRWAPRVDWIIVGGESGELGDEVRPMHPAWARTLRDQAAAARIPFFFKQWGAWRPTDRCASCTCVTGELCEESRSRVVSDTERVQRVGKKRAGRELDGRTWDEMPAAPAAVAP